MYKGFTLTFLLLFLLVYGCIVWINEYMHDFMWVGICVGGFRSTCMHLYFWSLTWSLSTTFVEVEFNNWSHHSLIQKVGETIWMEDPLSLPLKHLG